MGKNVHVVYHTDGDVWQVKYENEHEPVGMFDTKELAQENGREMAMQQKSELIIHRKDGVISEKHSYGNDPRGVRG